MFMLWAYLQEPPRRRVPSQPTRLLCVSCVHSRAYNVKRIANTLHHTTAPSLYTCTHSWWCCKTTGTPSSVVNHRHSNIFRCNALWCCMDLLSRGGCSNVGGCCVCCCRMHQGTPCRSGCHEHLCPPMYGQAPCSGPPRQWCALCSRARGVTGWRTACVVYYIMLLPREIYCCLGTLYTWYIVGCIAVFVSCAIRSTCIHEKHHPTHIKHCPTHTKHCPTHIPLCGCSRSAGLTPPGKAPGVPPPMTSCAHPCTASSCTCALWKACSKSTARICVVGGNHMCTI